MQVLLSDLGLGLGSSVVCFSMCSAAGTRMEMGIGEEVAGLCSEAMTTTAAPMDYYRCERCVAECAFVKMLLMNEQISDAA